jgi:hypothetical protein
VQDDPNTCYYYDQYIPFTAGPNIISLSVLPDIENSTVFDILSPLSEFITLVKDEAGLGIYQDQFGSWNDNIGIWQPSEGYIVYIDRGDTLGLTVQDKIDLPLNIPSLI